MLSIKGLGKAKADAGGYCTQLARDDYYTHGGGEPPGQWLGAGCAPLGLGGQVDASALKHLLAGRGPVGGLGLTRTAGDNHYAGWDLTLSAPKSVSALWATTRDPAVRQQIEEAHRVAVERTLAFAEAHCALTRRGAGGVVSEPVAGLVAAGFPHATSRALDPQLHTHVLIANLARRDDGGWGTLDGRHLFRWKMTLGALYRADCAAELQQRLGLGILRERGIFAVAGVAPALVKQFSKRRAGIEQWLEAHGYDGARAAATAALRTREAKPYSERPALFRRWEAEGEAVGWGQAELEALMQGSGTRSSAPPLDLAALREELLEQRSTVGERDVGRAVAVAVAEAMPGRGGLAAVQTQVAAFFADPQVIALGQDRHGDPRWSTRAMLALERDLAARALVAARDRTHALPEACLAPALQTLAEARQAYREALRHLCQRSGSVATLEGLPGTGKSTLLEAARTAWEAGGYQVIGCALSGKAADGLQGSAGIASCTLHAQLQCWEQGLTTLDHRSVVVDQAGMVGSRMLARVMDQVQRAGAKLVLVGDHKQLQPIEAGGIFRALSERLPTPVLTSIQRQRQPWMRTATLAITQGRVGEAVSADARHGCVQLLDTQRAPLQALITTWAAIGDQSPQASRLMLASTRADVRALNGAARAQLQAQGRLGPGIEVPTTHGPRHFSVGERLLCTRNRRAEFGVRNGMLGTLEQIQGKGAQAVLQVRLDAPDGAPGRLVTLPLSQYPDLEYGYALTVHKAQGATADHVVALGRGETNNRELFLVMASRHRDGLQLYLDPSTYDALQAPAEGPDQGGRPRGRAAASQTATGPLPEVDQALPSPTAARPQAAMETFIRQAGISAQKDTTLDYGLHRAQPSQRLE